MSNYSVAGTDNSSAGNDPLSLEANQQQVEVNGMVTDAETGDPLPGVNIVVQGTTTGATTDMSGEYSIEVSEDATLVFSFIGYQEKTVQVDGRQEINVTLQQAVTELEEVVAVGYGTKTRGELTGSVTAIGGDQIEEAPTANLQRSLQGKMAGLKIIDRGGQPGEGNMEMLIRGKSTLGNNDPLIVIDGVPQESFSHLSPQDIENISVLKDASAAIYGAKAANGVILIQTKRGQEGEAEITLNSTYGTGTFTRDPDLMSSYQYAKYQNEAAARTGEALPFSQEDLDKYSSGEFPRTHPNTNWWAATYQDWAPQTNHNLAARGGSENVQYYLSGDYLFEESQYRGSDHYNERYQIRSNVDAQVTDYLDVGFNLTGRLRNVHTPMRTPEYEITQAKPTVAAFYPNGLPGRGIVGLNPAIQVQNKAHWSFDKEKLFRSKLSFDLDLNTVTEGLALDGYASFDYEVTDTETFTKEHTVYTYDPNEDEYIPEPGYFGNRRTLDKIADRDLEQFYNIRLNYDRSFGDHNVDGFVAYEQSEGIFDHLSGGRIDLISNQKVQLWASSKQNQSITGYSEERGRINYVGSVGYDYQQRYMIDITLRRDGSFNFPEDGRFGLFPGVSLGWRISEESFMSGVVTWLDDLKLRTSWAKMGNDRVPSFQYLTKYDFSRNSGYYTFGVTPERHNGFFQSNVPNPNITWEISRNWNAGFDATMFDEMLTANFDYFYEKRRNILIQRTESVPKYTGLSLPDENLGKVDNYGFELQLNHQNEVGNFRYSVGGNVMYNQNEIVYMDEAKDVPPYRQKEGHPLSSKVVYKTDGIFNTQEEIENTEVTLEDTKPGDIKYVDVNGDGEISGEDRYRRYEGQSPDLQFGLNLSAEYGGFRVQAFFHGQAGAENFIAYPYVKQKPEYLFTKRWTENNTDASYPRAYQSGSFYNSKRSDFWLYDARFIRLNNLRLSYSFPDEMLTRTGLNRLRVFVKGSNLWTYDSITQRTGSKDYNPEMVSGQGFGNFYNAGMYFRQRSIITVGVNVSL